VRLAHQPCGSGGAFTQRPFGLRRGSSEPQTTDCGGRDTPLANYIEVNISESGSPFFRQSFWCWIPRA